MNLPSLVGAVIQHALTNAHYVTKNGTEVYDEVSHRYTLPSGNLKLISFDLSRSSRHCTDGILVVLETEDAERVEVYWNYTLAVALENITNKALLGQLVVDGRLSV